MSCSAFVCHQSRCGYDAWAFTRYRDTTQHPTYREIHRAGSGAVSGFWAGLSFRLIDHGHASTLMRSERLRPAWVAPRLTRGRPACLMLGVLRRWAKVEVFGARVDG